MPVSTQDCTTFVPLHLMVPTFDPPPGPVRLGIGADSRLCVVRFGSEADISSGQCDVCFVL